MKGRSIGMILLAVYLIIVGVITLFPIAGLGMLNGVIALLAGIAILIGR